LTAAESGPLSTAVLQRNETLVSHILLCNSAAIGERDRLGYSPLHLAFNWGRGMKLLLDHGGRVAVNEPNDQGHIPFAYAAQAQCVDGVKLLLEAGSSLSSPKHNGSTEELLMIAVRLNNTELVDIAIDAIRNRRNLLQSLAREKLPADLWQRLTPTESSVLDSSARGVQDALVAVGVEVMPALSVCTDNISVYHCEQLTPAHAEKLFQAGFRDIDAADSHGRTPLVWHSTFFGFTPTISWLISKGADPERRVEGNIASHYVCHSLGISLHYQIVVPTSTHWETAMLSPEPDLCQCACSSDGCLPITMFFKPALSSKNFDMKWLDRVCNTKSIPNPVALAILRALTFRHLELRHTCCRMDFHRGIVRKYYDEAEFYEIQDEERESIDKLEELMEEFSVKYEELGLPFISFVEEYWEGRMEEVLDARGKERLQEDEIARIRALGVVLRPEELDLQHKASSAIRSSTSGVISDEDT
jgi:hypothetical protein